MFQRDGLDAFTRHETANALQPLPPGPFKPLLEALHRLQSEKEAPVKVRTALVDIEIAAAVKDLLQVRGGRQLFRYACDAELYNLTGRKLNEYIQRCMGDEFTAKDFRTWGGTLEAAIAFAELGDPPDTALGQRRAVAAVMRRVAERLGNTPAVTRASYVSPAVVEQYLDGRTIDDFRPRHLRIVGARDIGLDVEEQGLLSLLRSWRIRRSRAAA